MIVPRSVLIAIAQLRRDSARLSDCLSMPRFASTQGVYDFSSSETMEQWAQCCETNGQRLSQVTYLSRSAGIIHGTEVQNNKSIGKVTTEILRAADSIRSQFHPSIPLCQVFELTFYPRYND